MSDLNVADPMAFTYRDEPKPPAIAVGDVLLLDGREVTVIKHGFGPVTRLNHEQKAVTFYVTRWVMSDGSTLTADERIYLFHAKRLFKGTGHVSRSEQNGKDAGQDAGPANGAEQPAAMVASGSRR